MNTMLDASMVVARTHGSAFLVQGAQPVAEPAIALSHGNEATLVT
jgi:hypothetical protein